MDKKLIALGLLITIVQLSKVQLCSGQLFGSPLGSILNNATTQFQDKKNAFLNSFLNPSVLPVSGNNRLNELLQTVNTLTSKPEIFDTIGQFGTVVRSLLGPLTLPYALDFNLPSNGNNTYDYVIVGAGSAGSTLAARLSKDSNNKVLVIEAGGEENKFNNLPIVAILTQRTEIDWGYYSVPQKRSAKGLNNNQIPASRGKCVGGSSSINLMVYSRGNPLDYDAWEESGAKGWNSSAMNPYFVIMEDNADPLSEPGYHGTKGNITVSTVDEPWPIDSAFYQGLIEAGVNIGDYNGEDQKRFQFTPFTIRDGERCSTGRAFLGPASSRDNLDVLLFSRVTKIIFDKDRAVGVEFTNSNTKYQVFASKKVIICTGGIATPQLLMLSGIGPKDQLDKFKIPIVHESPGVGKNLQDHPFTFLMYTTRADSSIVLVRDFIPNFLVYEATQHHGKFATSGANVVGFYRSKYANDSRPDLQIYEFSYGFGGGAPDLYLGYIFNFDSQTLINYALPNTLSDGTAFVISLVKPRSVGSITLHSDDIRDSPLIDYNFFTDPDDLNAMVEGCKFVLNISKTEAMQTISPKRYNSTLPGCEEYPLDSDDYLRCLIQTITYTLWHTVGTAKMGSPDDPMAVVDPELHVIGVKDLMIVDTSVIPIITTGNTNVPTIALAWRASDMLQNRVLRAKKLPYKNEEDIIGDYIPYQMEN